MKRWTILILLTFLGALASGCAAAEPEPTATLPLPTLAATVSLADSAQELNRGRLLVAGTVTAYGLEEGVPLLAQGDVGAERGFGLRHSSGGVEAHIYVFADEARQNAGLELLKTALPDGVQQPLWTTNGALLLLVAVAPDADLEALRPVQSELLAALSGAG